MGIMVKRFFLQSHIKLLELSSYARTVYTLSSSPALIAVEQAAFLCVLKSKPCSQHSKLQVRCVICVYLLDKQDLTGFLTLGTTHEPLSSPSTLAFHSSSTLA